MLDPSSLDPSLAAAAGLKGAAQGSTGLDGARLINSHARANANIEFGAVHTHAVGDAIALRKRLGTAGSMQ